MIPSAATERAAKGEIRSLPVDGSFKEFDLSAFDRPDVPLRAWRSRYFTVHLYPVPSRPEMSRLSIQRSMANAMIRPKNRDLHPISWDCLQGVKAAVGFGDRWAVEIYPPEVDVVDVAPMRHLWILETAPAYAWRKIENRIALREAIEKRRAGA